MGAKYAWPLLVVVAAAACGDDGHSDPDASETDAGATDAAITDAGSSDAPQSDAALLDAGPADAAIDTDGQASDALPPADAGPPDATGTDAGVAQYDCLVPTTHPTILDAITDLACVYIGLEPGSHGANGVVIDRNVTIEGTGPTAVVNDPITVDAAGITVVLADFEMTGLEADNGGAIRVVQPATLELHGMLLRDLAVNEIDDDQRGGAIYGPAGGDLLLSATTIRNAAANVAEESGDAYGGGIYWAGGTIVLQNASAITDCAARAAPGDPGQFGPYRAAGGAIYAVDTDVTLGPGTVVSNNQAYAWAESNSPGRGGAIYVNGGNLAIAAGSELSDNLANGTSARGGAIYLLGDLTMDGATVERNEARGGYDMFLANTQVGGGGIYVVGAAVITNSRVADNTVDATTNDAVIAGGGVWHAGSSFAFTASVAENNHITGTAVGFFGPPAVVIQGGGISAGGAASITDSTIVGNSVSLGISSPPMSPTPAMGGGARLSNTVTISGSTFSGNRVFADNAGADGGGLALSTSAAAHVTNSTIADNEAAGPTGRGGGLWLDDGAAGTVALSSVTIAGNMASADGGGLWNGTTLVVRNTIVAANSAPTGPDCVAVPALDSAGYNLIQDVGGCAIGGDVATNITSVPAELEPLADNGGPTQTHALGPTSPAIDAGNPTGCTDDQGAPLTTDQRGLPRVGVCDIGSFERQ